jgi:hypothetical protein
MAIRLDSNGRGRTAVGWWRLFFLLAGIPTFLIGVLDLLSAADLEARLLGLILSVAGGLMCTVGILREASRQLAQAGAVAGILVGILFVSVASSDWSWSWSRPWPWEWLKPWPTGACIVGFMVACLCGTSLVLSSLRLRSQTVEENATTDERSPTGAGSSDPDETNKPSIDKPPSSMREGLLNSGATLVAALLALVGIWYGASYAPAVTTPALNIQVEFDDVAEGENLRAIPIVITAKNAGNRTLRMLQSLL